MGISFWCPLRSWNPNLAMVLELRADPAWTSFHKSVPLSILSTQYGRKIRVISQNPLKKWLIVLHIWGLFHYPQTPNCPFWIEHILFNHTKLVVFFWRTWSHLLISGIDWCQAKFIIIRDLPSTHSSLLLIIWGFWVPF